MSRAVAVWLDHTRATLMEFAPGMSPTLGHIKSGVEPVRQSTGHIPNLPPAHGVGAVAHGSAERRHDQQLRKFYEGLAKRVEGAERVAVLGPGRAREEFAEVLRRTPGPARALKAVEPVDSRLTEAQVVARARELLQA